MKYYLIATFFFCVLFSQGLIRLRHSWKYSYFVFLLVSALENDTIINCHQQAEGEDGSGKAGNETCETSEMCVRKTTSTPTSIFLQYEYKYELACEDNLLLHDLLLLNNKTNVNELTDNEGCTQLVENNDGGCMTIMFGEEGKYKYIEFCCCKGDK